MKNRIYCKFSRKRSRKWVITEKRWEEYSKSEGERRKNI